MNIFDEIYVDIVFLKYFQVDFAKDELPRSLFCGFLVAEFEDATAFSAAQAALGPTNRFVVP